MSRLDLLEQLENEAAMGWPRPWFPQDRAAAVSRPAGLTERQADALNAYLDAISVALTSDYRRHLKAA
jgi:hypothetical protein